MAVVELSITTMKALETICLYVRLRDAIISTVQFSAQQFSLFHDFELFLQFLFVLFHTVYFSHLLQTHAVILLYDFLPNHIHCLCFEETKKIPLHTRNFIGLRTQRDKHNNSK